MRLLSPQSHYGQRNERTPQYHLQNTEDLGMKSYATRTGQLLTDAMKETHKVKATALLNNLEHKTDGLIRFFSDKENFNQDQKLKRRNNCWICKRML